MRYAVAFLQFWYDFVIGDDWRIAAGVVAVLAIGALAVWSAVSGDWLAPTVGLGLVGVFSLPMLRARP